MRTKYKLQNKLLNKHSELIAKCRHTNFSWSITISKNW